MSKESRINTLNAVAEQRKEECLDTTEKAITKLLKTNERISFGSVAREAGVSVSYLYKYPEIKERIQNLREQQRKGVQKLTRPQTASEKSKQVIIDQLRNRIKTLEGERQEQEKKIQVMSGRLYEMGRDLDLVDRLKAENSRLNDESKQLRGELKSTQNELNDCQQRLITNNPKIASLTREEFSNRLMMMMSAKS